jgi:hypothetical protein
MMTLEADIFTDQEGGAQHRERRAAESPKSGSPRFVTLTHHAEMMMGGTVGEERYASAVRGCPDLMIRAAAKDAEYLEGRARKPTG